MALACGNGFSLVLRSNGKVFAWGAGDMDQTNIPPGLSNVIAIAAGGGHSLALRADGTVVCWGATGEIELPANLTDIIAVAAGGYNSLVLKGDASVFITVPPRARRVDRGANATFTVMAAGDPPMSYQWRFNGTNIPGATQNIYTRINVQTTNAGLYSVVVSNFLGAVTSPPAPLFVNIPLLLTANGFIPNGFKVTVTGPPFVNVVLETSVNLNVWNPRVTNSTGGNGSFSYTDGAALNLVMRYYRARLQ